MNLETETWEIINSYFRDTPNYLVRHHIDSYNDFIHNKIPQIMKNFQRIPPYVLIDKDDKNVTYEVKVFYGGKTHDRYKITRPTIINYPSGESRQLFPNESRLKNVTYGFDFFFDVDIEYTMKKNDIPILEGAQSAYSDSLRDIYLGKIPIMLRSDLCILSTATGDLLTQMGEDKYDLGGYFILDGAEKVIVSQERKAENIVFLTSIPQTSGNEKYTHKAEVKCVSDEAFANARTVQVQLESRGGAITVRLGQERPLLQENQHRDVPLFIMFRALGVETDKEILEYIIGSLEGELPEKIMDLLHPSILDPFIVSDEIYDKERAETYLVKLPTRSQQSDRKDIVASFSEVLKSKTTLLSYLYNTFNEAFFPHITSTTGDINKAKAYYLGYVTRRLLLLRLG
jgi:DNA-directed RNA polymerase II subunit RPB2